MLIFFCFTHTIIMAYYNYHAIIKRKILLNKLIKAEFVSAYKKIKPALDLYFNDGSIYPIREHKFNEYLPLIEKHLK